MTILLKTKHALVRHLNEVNGVDVDHEEITHGVPADVAGTWREGQVNGDTAVRIVATDTSAVKGSAVITYNRVPLEALNTLFTPFAIQAWQPVNTTDLVPFIRIRYGIEIEASQIVDEPITTLTDGAGEVVLTAKPEALGWTGSVTVTVTEGGAAIGEFLTNTALDGLNYPATPHEGPAAVVYAYPYDFSNDADYLLTLSPGEVLPWSRRRSADPADITESMDVDGFDAQSNYLRYTVDDPSERDWEGQGGTINNRIIYISWSYASVPRGHAFIEFNNGQGGGYPRTFRIFGVLYTLYRYNSVYGYYAPESHSAFIETLNGGDYENVNFESNRSRSGDGAFEYAPWEPAADVLDENNGPSADYAWVDTTDNVATFEVSATNQIIVDLDQPTQTVLVHRDDETLENYPEVITWDGNRLLRNAIDVGNGQCIYDVETASFFDDANDAATAETALTDVIDSQRVTFVPAHPLLDVVNKQFPDTWELDGMMARNDLGGAEIVYNGLNDPALPTNQTYKYVLGIRTHEQQHDQPGVMYLHYNDAFDPDVI